MGRSDIGFFFPYSINFIYLFDIKVPHAYKIETECKMSIIAGPISTGFSSL